MMASQHHAQGDGDRADTGKLMAILPAAEAEAARVAINSFSRSPHQIDARNYSLFTPENKTLENIFSVRREATAPHYIAFEIGSGDAWSRPENYRMPDGVSVRVVAGALSFRTDVFTVNPDGTIARHSTLSDAANAFHLSGDQRGVQLAKDACKIARFWPAADFIINNSGQEIVIKCLTILAEKLCPHMRPSSTRFWAMPAARPTHKT